MVYATFRYESNSSRSEAAKKNYARQNNGIVEKFHQTLAEKGELARSFHPWIALGHSNVGRMKAEKTKKEKVAAAANLDLKRARTRRLSANYHDRSLSRNFYFFLPLTDFEQRGFREVGIRNC